LQTLPPLLLGASRKGYIQLFYPIRCPNPERGLLGLLNAKQRHSEKGSRPEPKLLRAGNPREVLSS